MKKNIIWRLSLSLIIILLSGTLIIVFISQFHYDAYGLFLPMVYIPVFILLILHQIIYNIFFFISLKKNIRQIKDYKSIKKLFSSWQKIMINISRIITFTVFIGLSVWFGFSFMLSTNYEKGVNKYTSIEKLVNFDVLEFQPQKESYSDFASLYPMIAYSNQISYIGRDENFERKINITIDILEALPNSLVDSYYEHFETSGTLTNIEKVCVPFTRGDIIGYYTVETLAEKDGVSSLNSTEIAVKLDNTYLRVRITFSNKNDYVAFNVDKAISAVCDLAKAVQSHSLYSVDKAFYEFYEEYA